MDQPERNNVDMNAASDRPTQVGHIQTEIQFRAYFVTTVDGMT
jgi:hypothetical protein